MRINNRWSIYWFGWKGELFYWKLFRFNSGDPYCDWRIGPVSLRKWGGPTDKGKGW
jgi:hypothetical protein